MNSASRATTQGFGNESETGTLAQVSTTSTALQRAWECPIDLDKYDCTASLSASEKEALDLVVSKYMRPGYRWPKQLKQDLRRLTEPMADVAALVRIDATEYQKVRSELLRNIHKYQTSFWGWSDEQWVEIIRTSESRRRNPHFKLAFAYVICGFSRIYDCAPFDYVALASKIFGTEAVSAAIEDVRKMLVGVGYADNYRATVSLALLLNRSPYLSDLTTEILEEFRNLGLYDHFKKGMYTISRALAQLGVISRPIESLREKPENRAKRKNPARFEGIAREWLAWCDRWYETSTLTLSTRNHTYGSLLKTGRWLSSAHPEIVSPAQWTRELAAEFVSVVDKLNVGEWSHGAVQARKQGKPLKASSKQEHLYALKMFIGDCQEWEWIARRFSPGRAFSTPRSLRSLLGTNPRVIEENIWAKLLWAGLSLNEDHLGTINSKGNPYPIQMVKALALVWLFSGLRSNEIWRLRLGCIRWEVNVPEPTDLNNRSEVIGSSIERPPSAKSKICYLDVPVNKTSIEFTKPVDWPVGVAINEWEAVRPEQPMALDRKTGELVSFLFSCRGKQISLHYIGKALIPLLCRIAGVPRSDTRGNITSHRARSTIATQLYNADEPMSLEELQEWLGHNSPQSTQVYAKITPRKLRKSFEQADYFRRNVRMIKVLIDRDAVMSGAVLNGEPWQFYDLGHGYCTYDFFSDCKHRMACARCDFYTPKNSSRAQLLEAKSNLQRMKQEIPLSVDELAAVEDGIVQLDKLYERLADVPTPAGPTPRELGDTKIDSGKGTFIPLQSIQRKAT